MLDREACYRALELCHGTMVLGGNRRLDFGEWYANELAPMLAAGLGTGSSPVEDRAMQARAVQVVDAYSTSLGAGEFGGAFQSVARLMGAQDLVTALCAARYVRRRGGFGWEGRLCLAWRAALFSDARSENYVFLRYNHG